MIKRRRISGATLNVQSVELCQSIQRIEFYHYFLQRLHADYLSSLLSLITEELQRKIYYNSSYGKICVTFIERKVDIGFVQEEKERLTDPRSQ